MPEESLGFVIIMRSEVARERRIVVVWGEVNASCKMNGYMNGTGLKAADTAHYWGSVRESGVMLFFIQLWNYNKWGLACPTTHVSFVRQ